MTANDYSDISDKRFAHISKKMFLDKLEIVTATLHNHAGIIDGYTRGRLRRILRKRRKKKGRGRGKDHQRWPNAYFTTMGLYSLRQPHQMARQSF